MALTPPDTTTFPAATASSNDANARRAEERPLLPPGPGLFSPSASVGASSLASPRPGFTSPGAYSFLRRGDFQSPTGSIVDLVFSPRGAMPIVPTSTRSVGSAGSEIPNLGFLESGAGFPFEQGILIELLGSPLTPELFFQIYDCQSPDLAAPHINMPRMLYTLLLLTCSLAEPSLGFIYTSDNLMALNTLFASNILPLDFRHFDFTEAQKHFARIAHLVTRSNDPIMQTAASQLIANIVIAYVQQIRTPEELRAVMAWHLDYGQAAATMAARELRAMESSPPNPLVAIMLPSASSPTAVTAFAPAITASTSPHTNITVALETAAARLGLLLEAAPTPRE